MLPFTESKSIGRFGRCEYEHICYGGGLPECFLSPDIGYSSRVILLLLEARRQRECIQCCGLAANSSI